MHWNTPSSILVKYYLYMIIRMVWFAGPVYVFVFRSGGLSYTAIHVVEFSYLITVSIAETPTGYIGDRIGRRNGLLVGVMILTFANLGFGIAHTTLDFVVVYIIFGIGETFSSGTDSAWLYDILKERNLEDEFTKIRGWSTGLGLIASGFAALLGGYLGEIDLFYPFVASAIMSFLGIPVLLSLPASERYADDGNNEPISVRKAVSISRETLLRPSLRSFVVYMVLFFGALGVINVWIQPISRSLGLEISHIGWLYASLIGISGVLSYFSGEIQQHFGTRIAFLFAPLAVGGFAVAVLVIPLMALPAFFAMRGCHWLIEPLEQQYLNDRTPSLGRATVLSSVAMLKGAFAAPIEIAGGVVADIYSPITAMGVIGVVLIIGSVIIWL